MIIPRQHSNAGEDKGRSVGKKEFFRRFGGLIVLGLAVAFRLYVYAIGASTVPVTTDEAITVLQAKAVLRGHFPLLMMAQPYMFPLEAYWMAPLEWCTPRTAAGMRVLAVLEGLVFLGLGIKILRDRLELSKSARVAGWLLVLFPSAYLIATQFGYSQPHNNSAFILALLGWAFTAGVGKGSWKRQALFALLAAGSAGLAIGNAILSVSLAAPVFVVLAWNGLIQIRRSRWSCLAVWTGTGIGLMIGLAPYWLARMLVPGSYGSVTGTRSFHDAMRWLWSPTIIHTLPRALGVDVCLFPDTRTTVGFGGSLVAIIGAVTMGILLMLTVMRAWRWLRGIWTRRPVPLGMEDMAAATGWLCYVAFLFAKRGGSSEYRYLVPIAVVLPFLVAGFVNVFRIRLVQVCLCALVAGWVALNVGTTWVLMKAWQQPGFGTDVIHAPPMDGVIDYLDQHGIRYTVASHWAAYRLTFYSDERIISAQPYNERFPGWPVPYKDQVDTATNVAYVLTDRIRFLKPSIFDRHLRTMGVTSHREQVDEFVIYHDFTNIVEASLVQLPVSTARTSIEGDKAERVHDGDLETEWTSRIPQAAGMWVEVELPKPEKVRGMRLHYGRFRFDAARTISVKARTDAGWTNVLEQASPSFDKFQFLNGHPVYGGTSQRLLWDGPVKCDALRITLVEPTRPPFCWTFTEINVLGERGE